MSDWSPPDSDFASDVNMGEGITPRGGRVSPATQAARDRAAGVLRATFEDNSGLGDSVDVQVAKVAGRKPFSPPAQDFAFTPPQSDFQAPAEKSETGPSLMDQFLAPWKGETAGSLVKQNAFVRLADYGTKILDKQKQIAAEHPDMGPLEVASLARQQYKDQYGHAPELDINWSELPHQIYRQITDQPAAFVSNLFKSLVVDPEMLLLGTTGLPAKLAQAGSKVAAATVRAGEVGAQMGAQSAGISAAEQLQKSGEVAAQPTAQAAAQGAGMGLALGALYSAVSVGLRAVGKEKGAPVTPEVEQEFAKRFDADVQDGMPASVAMAKNMRDAGMDPKEADAMGAAVSRADRAMNEVLRSMQGERDAAGEGIKQEGDGAEHTDGNQGGQAAEAGGGDRLQRGAQEENGPGQVERRADAETRARVDQMSPAEMRKALFTDDLTGLPNRRAYAEADKQPITASIDVDGLKWINDNLGHEAGDQLIRQVGDALKQHDAYHLSGDEFVAQFPDRESARAAMAAFQDTLSKSKFEFVTPKGERIVIDGPGATHGIGDTNSAADAALRAGKLSKELSGERATRGGSPPRLQRVQPEAVSETGERAPAGDQVQAPDPRLAQSGKADPRLLGLLALPGVGAAVGYWLGGNAQDKVRNALIGGGIGAASLLLGKVRGAAHRVVDAIADKRYNPTNLFEQVQGDKAAGRLAGYQFSEALKGMVPDAARRSAMTYELEANNRAALTPAERVALQTYETHMRAVRDAAVRAGVDMGAVIDNYATHAYVRGANTREGLLDNLLNIMKAQGGPGGMSPNSRWARQRVIPSYREAEAHGLIPVTTDIAEIARMYTDSVTRTVANKHFLDALAQHKTPAGEPLLAKSADLEAEIKRRTAAVTGRDSDMVASQKLNADIAAIKSPRDYVFINHPQLRDFKVHRDIAPPLQALMDATDPLAIEKALHGVAVAAKSIIFSGSLFHAKSLVDAAAGTGLSAFKRGALKSIRDPSNELVKLAVRSGLNIIDRPMEAEIAPMRNALRLIEAKTPFPISAPVKGLRFAQDGMNHFLWGVVHPTLKWNVWSSIFERATNPGGFQKLWNQFGRKLGMAPNWDGMAPYDIAKLTSTFTNSIFGGINWFDIANNVNSKYLRDLSLAFASPRGRRLQQILMLAPDWTVATAQSFYKAFPGMSEPQVGALHRQYLLRQAIIYLTAYDAINMAMSGHHIWQNQDPTMIDAGDGRRIQMAKHTMEPIHWLTQPAQQAWNKLGYPIKEPALQMLGKDWISLKGPDVSGPPITNRLTHALKGVLPIPATTAAEQGAGPALSGFVGIPIYGKTEEQAIDAAIKKALGVYRQKQEDGTKQRYRSEGQAEAAATKRVQKQYQKRRDEQAQRESP